MMEAKFWIVCLLGIIASTMACKGAGNAGNNETKTVWPARPDPECAGKLCGEDCRVEKNGTLEFEGICKGHGYCFSPSCPSCPDLECKDGDKFDEHWCLFISEYECKEKYVQENCGTLCQKYLAIDCKWGDWVEGECSAACGNGTRINTRTRVVNATNGGNECKGEETEEVECSQFPGNESTPAQCCATCGVHNDCSGLCRKGPYYEERLDRSVGVPSDIFCEPFLPAVDKCWKSSAESDYIVAEFGGICTGKENFPLVDKDDCMRASKSLSKKFFEQESAIHPRGCYFDWNSNVIWNTHKTGKIRGDCAAICRTTHIFLWHETASNKFCPYSALELSVNTQVDCQALCEAKDELECVGITYSHMNSHLGLCYLCEDDRLKDTDLTAGYSFYRRPV